MSSYPCYSKDYLWDLWCLSSIIGIWPRYIEPKLIKLSSHLLLLPHLPLALEGLKILQIGDTHIHKYSDSHFFQRVKKKIHALKPDLIFFTGDFICHGLLDHPQLLQDFFQALRAPYGIYAVLGNHDYDRYISLENTSPNFLDKRFPVWGKIYHEYFRKKTPPKSLPQTQVPLNEKLCKLLEKCGIQLLHNQSVKLTIHEAHLNVIGIGDLWTEHFLPEKAFEKLSASSNRVVNLLLTHNPEAIDQGLLNYPFDVLFAGHTHGSQVNLPYLGIHPTNTFEKKYKRGWYQFKDKHMYITRGLSSPLPFRWFSPPEIALFTLKKGKVNGS